jgi:hypothetical protein
MADEQQRIGPFGLLSALGGLLTRTTAGKVIERSAGADGTFLRSRPADPSGTGLAYENVEGGIGYVLGFGARFPALSAQGRWHHAHGEASSSNATVLDATAQLTAPKTGTIRRLAWNTDSADATTQYEIFINGLAAGTVNLTGASGVDATLALAITAGDLVTIQYLNGTPPGGSVADMFVE